MFRQRKHYNKSPMRRKVPGVGAETYRGTRCNITCTIDATLMSAVTRVTFNKPVIFSGILPGWSTPAPDTVLSVARVSAVAFDFTWSASQAPGTDVTIPFEDPSFRDQSGGYVQSGQVTTI